MCVINANCQGLSRPIVASQECEAEPCSPDCWGFQLLSLSSRLPHTACVTRVLPSTKPLNSVLTSHSSSLWTLELPVTSWQEGRQPVLGFSVVQLVPCLHQLPPRQSVVPGGPCTAPCYPSERPSPCHKPLLTP